MDPTPPPIDWNGEVYGASRDGHLLALLHTLPRSRWTERSPRRLDTFLHMAARGHNVDAAVALLQCGLDVNARDASDRTAVHFAALRKDPHMMEVLCAGGADLRAQSKGATPLSVALLNRMPRSARVLVANGVRLDTVREQDRSHITPELEELERGVLRCRAAVVALLGLKRRRGDVMWALDRWVVRELCFAIWATRTDIQWSL